MPCKGETPLRELRARCKVFSPEGTVLGTGCLTLHLSLMLCMLPESSPLARPPRPPRPPSPPRARVCIYVCRLMSRCGNEGVERVVLCCVISYGDFVRVLFARGSAKVASSSESAHPSIQQTNVEQGQCGGERGK